MPEPLPYRRPPPDAPESGSRSRSSIPSVSDGLGDRHVSLESGSEACVETRRFDTRFSDADGFETALRAQVDRLRPIRHTALATIVAVERRDNALCLISRLPSGRRLFELAESDDGWAFALKVVREMLPALMALYKAGAGAHGAIAAPRILVTREGRLVLVEHVLAPALESLNLTREEFRARGIVVSDGDADVRFTELTDLAQLGYVALSVLVARPLDARDFPACLPELLDEFEAGMGSPAAAAKVRVWLERAMQVADVKPFASARDAQRALEELSADPHVQAAESAGALLAFGSEEEEDGEESQAQEVKIDEPRPSIFAVPLERKAVAPPVTIDPPRPAPVVVETTAPVVPEPPVVATPPVVVKAPVAVKPAAVSKTPAVPKLPVITEPLVVAEPVAVPPRPAPVPARGRTIATTWMVAALAVLVLAETVVIGGLMYWRSMADVDERSPRAEQTADAASDALSVAALAPQSPTATSTNAVTPTPTPASAPASPAAVRPATPRVGGLTIKSAIDLLVLEDGATIGSTTTPLAVADGRHTLDFVNQTLGFRLALPVSVSGGKMTTLNVPVPNGRLSINAMPWAQVAIDGRDVGQTPLANLALPIGTHEVKFAHPEFGERHQTVVVKVDGIARVTQNFR